MNKDIKYLGVPNICFSLTDKDDERETEFKKQRIADGFDDSETWSLRDTITGFVLPRLIRYNEIANDTIVRSAELEKQTTDLIKAFTMLYDIEKGNDIMSVDESNEIEKKLKNFHKIFLSLWW